MKNKSKLKSVLSALLTMCMLISAAPVTTFAAQSNEYVDPADSWLSSNNRTNELDVNATTTYETSWCPVCDKETTVLTYRVPEYTRSGETAKNHGVWFSDGRNIDGTEVGNLDSGTPGIDAYYTGNHWTKSVCQNCGTINAVDGVDAYNFNKNLYSLNSCDHNFFLDFDNTTYTPYNENYHTTVYKAGKYCQFCKGTKAQASSVREAHNFNEQIDGQIGNNRFYVLQHCDDCNFEKSEYVTAKSVVSSYYGTADGEAHTVTVSDLSDSGVKTLVRYGDSADNCKQTSAPNYTKAGYYTVYYEITYSYSGEDMVENGVSYVWLLNDSASDDESGDDTVIIIPPAHEHDFRYIETVPATCENLGYERWQCSGCGQLEKKNYTPAIGHDHEDIVIREANCMQGGLILSVCKNCGDFYQTTTPTGAHTYKTNVINPTCRNVGYTEHICDICGDNYITDIKPLISHAYESITKKPTCEDKGYTTYTCTMCGSSYVSDYTDPTGHNWDEGHIITSSTCTSEGVTEYHCQNDGCNEKMIKADSATGHTPGKAATCTEPQICEVCQTVLAMPTGHHYHSEVIPPTCTSMGYTTYTCDCGDSYVGDYTDMLDHDYSMTVTVPTCTEHGFTTYSCKNCSEEYISDYTEKLPHEYESVITQPTCTSMGYTTYTCKQCGDTYKADYTDMTEHNYNKEVVEPTCTEHGYAIYTCPDCGKSYIGDYTDCVQHHYVETVIEPTCTEIGYTIFKCEQCGDEYKDNYTDKKPHRYTEEVTLPTCLELGYTTYTCEDCGDTYKGEYVEATGHTVSDWIIDTPATIEAPGQKHIECIVCGAVLQTVEIPQLIDTDNSDEDGNAEVGDYLIILTDKNGKPIFNSEITIDINDNVTIKLPSGRLLDYSDQTTITAIYTDTQSAKSDLQIFIYDTNNNAATGKTDENGQLKVPNSSSSTEDDNGTIGGENEEQTFTYVVTVTDKNGLIIPKCAVAIGESNDIVVKLPDGTVMDNDNRITVTVTDQNGNAQPNINVIVIGMSDFIEKGTTDIDGKVTLPDGNIGYTDQNGRVSVGDFIVLVSDESKNIAGALVTYNEDNTISVELPEGSVIDYDNRVTVTVLKKDGTVVKDMSVTVKDNTEATRTEMTNFKGQIIVPPLNEDEIGDDNTGGDVTTDDGDKEPDDPSTNPDNPTEEPDDPSTDPDNPTEEPDDPSTNPDDPTEEPDDPIEQPIYSYNIKVENNDGAVVGTIVTVDKETGKIKAMLPEGTNILSDNRIVVTVTDKEGTPVKGVLVDVVAKDGTTVSDVTNSDGIATVPPVNTDYTDVNGYSEVDGYIVTVVNEIGAIEKAFVTHNPEIKNEDGSIKTAENISIELPENVKFDYENRITVTVINKADGTAVKDMAVIVSELVKPDSETKTLSGITNKDGKIILPPLSEDVTDDNGDSDVSEETPGKGEDTDGDGVEDKPGEVITTSYKVSVKDTKGIITGSFVEIKDGKVTVTLPEDKTLTTSNQTTVTITDKDDKPVQGVSVTIKDKTTSKTGITNSNGQVTLPVKSSGGGGSSSGGSSGGGGGGGLSSYSSVNVKVVDQDGNNVSVTKSIGTDKVTLTLPTGKNLAKDDNYYTITVTDRNGKAKSDYSVILKDRNNNELTGTTDSNGVLILPAVEHEAYIVGYDDGTFRPDNDMSRAEAAAIFARLISEQKGEKISGKSSFKDVDNNEWYTEYLGYLAKYDIINGYSDGTFKPDNSVTRAEFVAMAVRYYELFNDVTKTGYTVEYVDVEKDYWAYNDVAYAKHIGWLNGYADGTFRGDNNITRAEVVTVVNRATGRTADKEYVNDNFTKLNRFTDVTDNTLWYFFDVNEAANTHKAVINDNGETWIK